jgi:hypothetical protein
MNELTYPAQWRTLRPRKLIALIQAAGVVGERVDGLGRALMDTLDGRTYETIAIRVMARRRCLYTWRGHCLIALAHPTDPRSKAEIAAIAAGTRALHGRDAAVVAAVDEVLDRREGLPALRRLGDDPLAFLFVTAFYDAVTALMEEDEPEPDAPVVPGLETPDSAVTNLDEGRL